MNVEITDTAQSEIDEAAVYLELERSGLGRDFLVEVRRAIEQIRSFPNAWQRISKRSRRCRLKRFQYGLIYQVRTDRIVVIAVMHLERKPNYWQDREA